MKSMGSIGIAVIVAALAGTSASAGVVGQCIKAGTAEYGECKATCKEDFQAAKDACTNKDHVCVDACREGRASCIEATGLAEAIDACNAARDAAIANCKVLYGAGTPERDQCIDNAQLDAFRCRDGVREEKSAAVIACRKAFRTCRNACPPGAGPVIDPRQCRSEAVTAFRACYATCREDLQLAKDACRNLDHDCVEQCRSERQTCKQPVRAALDAAIAACKAVRDAAVAACNGDDACIDQAQAVAFQCRDAAREAARPGFKACRDAFRACVRPACELPPAP